MKNNIAIILKVTGILAVFIYVMFYPATALADEDNDFSRPIYSLQEINEDMLGDTITFNSIRISDSDYEWYKEQPGNNIPTGTLRNETNFVGARIDDGAHGVNNQWEGTEIDAIDGETYVVRLYVHNNNLGGYDAVAEDTQVRFYVPYASSTEVAVNGWLTAANATPNTYLDDVIFKSTDGTPFHLEYVYNSALLENDGFASGAGVILPDSITNQGCDTEDIDDTWTLIGYDGPDGKIPGCYAYVNYVSIKVKVVYDYEFTIETKVRLAGGEDKEWKDTVEAKVGDKVEFQIAYVNTSDKQQDSVTIRDVLPANLRYIEGSSTLYNALHPNGATFDQDYLVENGVVIGNYGAHSNAYVRFTAEVVDESLAEGSNTLVNWGRVTVGQKMIQDYACVILYKDTKFQVISTILLVLIIILLIAIAVLLYMMFRKRPRH